MEEDERILKARIRQAKEFGCSGLIGGIAFNRINWTPCDAKNSTKKDGPFICKRCMTDAIIKKCIYKNDHFAHIARLSPTGHGNESDLHWLCKEKICSLLAERFPNGNWATERKIPSNPQKNVGELVPDVSGYIGDKKVVVEVQASTLPARQIIKRLVFYARWGVSVLWIIPLTSNLGDEYFRPRLFEKILHLIYDERVYYWWDDLGLTVKPVHYGVAERYIDSYSWFEDGEEKHGGGYFEPYVLVKRPIYGNDASIVDNFSNYTRYEEKVNDKLTIPRCLIWSDRYDNWWEKDELNYNTRLHSTIFGML